MKTFKKIILDDLKAQGFGHIAAKITSITYETFSMGSAVNVRTQNLFKTEREVLEKILDDYAYGTFDCMTDCSGIKPNIAKKERQAKYVHLYNNFSDDVKAAVQSNLASMGITDNTSAMNKRGRDYESTVWQMMCEMES